MGCGIRQRSAAAAGKAAADRAHDELAARAQDLDRESRDRRAEVVSLEVRSGWAVVASFPFELALAWVVQ